MLEIIILFLILIVIVFAFPRFIASFVASILVFYQTDNGVVSIAVAVVLYIGLYLIRVKSKKKEILEREEIERNERQKLKDEIRDEVTQELLSAPSIGNDTVANKISPEPTNSSSEKAPQRQYVIEEKQALIQFIKNNTQAWYVIGKMDKQLAFIETLEAYDVDMVDPATAIKFIKRTRKQYIKFAAPRFLSVLALIVLGASLFWIRTN